MKNTLSCISPSYYSFSHFSYSEAWNGVDTCCLYFFTSHSLFKYLKKKLNTPVIASNQSSELNIPETSWRMVTHEPHTAKWNRLVYPWFNCWLFIHCSVQSALFHILFSKSSPPSTSTRPLHRIPLCHVFWIQTYFLICLNSNIFSNLELQLLNFNYQLYNTDPQIYIPGPYTTPNKFTHPNIHRFSPLTCPILQVPIDSFSLWSLFY